MRPLHKKALLVLLIVVLPFLVADMGPKPSADFEIIYETDNPSEITGYTLFLCDTEDCSPPDFTEEFFTHFDCDQVSCNSWGYDYPELMYITFDFADGTTLISNKFSKKHFNAKYEILVGNDYLQVNETGGSNFGRLGGPVGWVIYGLIAAAICGGISNIAVIVLVIVLIIRKRRAKLSQAS
jgi:hypothetical protein